MSVRSKLAEQLLEITNPQPIFNDPEDDPNFETVAQLEDKYEEEEDEDQSQPKLSRLRIQNATCLANDERYAGKRISRQKLDKSDDESDQSLDEDDECDDEEFDEDFESAIEQFKSRLKSVENESENEDVEEFVDENSRDETRNDDSADDTVESGEDEIEEADETDGKSNVETRSDTDEVTKNFSKMDVGLEIEKGKATKNQLQMWDALLECRIKMQSVLQLTNRFPQHDTWPLFNDAAERCDQEFTKIHGKTCKKVQSLLDQLINLQSMLYIQHPDLVRLTEDEDVASNHDEEITSEEEEEVKPSSSRKRKLSVSEYAECLEKEHEKFVQYRNETIERWNDRTRLATGKLNSKSFNAFDQSTLKQIEQIMVDKDRLRRRCRTKRSTYRVFGKTPQIEAIQDPNQDPQTDASPEAAVYDPEIFDDDDFYQNLLRELIEKRTSASTDPLTGRQQLELDQLRNRTMAAKRRKAVDTKASKGRKVRYVVLPKLVSVMAPYDNSTMSHEARNDLFSSLFGKRRRDEKVAHVPAVFVN